MAATASEHRPGTTERRAERVGGVELPACVCLICHRWFERDREICGRCTFVYGQVERLWIVSRYTEPWLKGFQWWPPSERYSAPHPSHDREAVPADAVPKEGKPHGRITGAAKTEHAGHPCERGGRPGRRGG